MDERSRQRSSASADTIELEYTVNNYRMRATVRPAHGAWRCEAFVLPDVAGAGAAVAGLWNTPEEAADFAEHWLHERCESLSRGPC